MRRTIGILSAILLVFFLEISIMSPSPFAYAQAGEAHLSLADYRARVAEAIRMLAPQDAAAYQRLPALQEEFAAIRVVQYPSQESVNVEPLLGSPGAASTTDSSNTLTLEVALARLRTVRSQVDGSGNDRTEERLSRLAGVLARPEFAASETLWNRVQRWIRNLLRALLPEQVVNPGEIPGLSFLARIVGWIVAILGMVLLTVLLSYWLQGLLRSFVGDATIHKRSAGAGGVLTSAAVRQQAQEAANAGRYRNAVRRLYLSALLLLEEQGIVAHDRSLTNHEMLSSIDQDHPMRTYLQPVVEAFDEVWYGIHEPDLGTYVAYEQDVRNLVETATGNAPAGGRDGREAHG